MSEYPDGYRKLNVVFLDEIPQNTIGVYALGLGNKFYIGSSNNVRKRIMWHRSKINSLLGCALFGNYDDINLKTGSYPAIIQHLIENKDIVNIEVSLLNTCYYIEDALEEEKMWHWVVNSHALKCFCLNKLPQYYDITADLAEIYDATARA